MSIATSEQAVSTFQIMKGTATNANSHSLDTIGVLGTIGFTV